MYLSFPSKVLLTSYCEPLWDLAAGSLRCPRAALFDGDFGWESAALGLALLHNLQSGPRGRLGWRFAGKSQVTVPFQPADRCLAPVPLVTSVGPRALHVCSRPPCVRRALSQRAGRTSPEVSVSLSADSWSWVLEEGWKVAPWCRVLPRRLGVQAVRSREGQVPAVRPPVLERWLFLANNSRSSAPCPHRW